VPLDGRADLAFRRLTAPLDHLLKLIDDDGDGLIDVLREPGYTVQRLDEERNLVAPTAPVHVDRGAPFVSCGIEGDHRPQVGEERQYLLARLRHVAFEESRSFGDEGAHQVIQPGVALRIQRQDDRLLALCGSAGGVQDRRLAVAARSEQEEPAVLEQSTAHVPDFQLAIDQLAGLELSSVLKGVAQRSCRRD